MEPLQNLTNAVKDDDDVTVLYRYDMLDEIQRAYIDWKALGGIVTGDDAPYKITLEELANSYRITRQTFYDKTKHIPNLRQLIDERRSKFATQSRLDHIHKVWYLSASVPGPKGFRDRQMYLANFDKNFRMPTERREIEIGDNYAALLAAAAKDNIIDGEVITDVQAISATGGTDQPPHTQAS